MIEKYISNTEYGHYYENLSNLRSRIANDLPIKQGMQILDVGTGYAYFATEVGRIDSSLRIAGIDISKKCVKRARKILKKSNLQDQIEILQMDATRMNFHSEKFDITVNFTGLEDIHMTKGKDGVQQTFLEVYRVLKSKSCFCIVVMPPEEMETAAQKIEVALFSYICDATWLNSMEYEVMLDRAKFKLIKKKSYRTGKKLTPEQAICEIKYACKNVPKIYGIDTPSFEKVWAKFGKNIEENGLGHYSKVVLMIAQK